MTDKEYPMCKNCKHRELVPSPTFTQNDSYIYCTRQHQIKFCLDDCWRFTPGEPQGRPVELCMTCKAFTMHCNGSLSPQTTDEGECRRHAPRTVKEAQHWPPTIRATAWCAEWLSRDEDEE